MNHGSVHSSQQIFMCQASASSLHSSAPSSNVSYSYLKKILKILSNSCLTLYLKASSTTVYNTTPRIQFQVIYLTKKQILFHLLPTVQLLLSNFRSSALGAPVPGSSSNPVPIPKALYQHRVKMAGPCLCISLTKGVRMVAIISIVS
jgi:hypothetical protein